MSAEKTDFLRFSAASIKEYITRKLSENSKFTDQIYEGSNLAILIDLVSYMYQCLMFQLNNAAAESMFSDAQIYENINRLVRMLGYSPKGITPSIGNFFIDNTGGRYFESPTTLPPYSYIQLGKTDSHGNPICYSLNESVTKDQGTRIVNLTMYNGKWKLYKTVFTASGDDYETFILTGLGSDVTNNRLVADKGVDVYVQSNGVMTKWTLIDDEVFMNTRDTTVEYGKIFDQSHNVYNFRMNENKEFEIKFGNGIIGNRLNEGDKIFIFYFETNGMEGKIDAGDVPSGGIILKHSPEDLDIPEQLYMNIFGDVKIPDNIKVEQNLPSSTPKPEEDVESIRNNAATWFKTGRRLITEEDYKYYVLNCLNNTDIIDCVVQNNFDYTATFYEWLYNIGAHGEHKNPDYYLNETRLIKNNYKYVDAADGLNVYIWTKLRYGTIENLQNSVVQTFRKIKTLGSEVTFLKPVDVKFIISAAPEELFRDQLKSGENLNDVDSSYVEITLDNNSMYVTSEVQNRIGSIFEKYFLADNCKIGQAVNFQDICSEILDINGVEKIRTVYIPIDKTETPVIRNGLSFASWSDTNIIDIGEDLSISNSIRSLEKFQFPVLADTNFKNKIKVIKKSINSINSISY